jgi:hypothetical protein
MLYFRVKEAIFFPIFIERIKKKFRNFARDYERQHKNRT